jgi:signal transduction histidine kinase
MPGWHAPCSTPCMSTNFPLPREVLDTSQHPLVRAFASFTEAAGSLERAYGELQGQVVHLRQELEVTNRDLSLSLEENRRMRERLKRILESLPCGVLVIEGTVSDGMSPSPNEVDVDAKIDAKIEMKIEGRNNSIAPSLTLTAEGLEANASKISTQNPEAIRLLGGCFARSEELPRPLQAALRQACDSGEETEFALFDPASRSSEIRSQDTSSIETEHFSWAAIRHAWLDESASHPVSVFILRDISDAKKLEHEREHMRRQQALVEMSALLAHEIRNPLGSLELFAGLLAEANLEGESQGWIEHVQAGLRTLSSTVNNVLHLHTTPPAEFASVDAGELLEWAYGFLHPLAKQAGVEIQVVNGLHGVTIDADRHRLEQVLLNLALNAFHFMPGGGWFSLRGRADVGSSNGIAIEVRDTGTGIGAVDLEHIFDAGFSTRPGSSGLGLAVCRRVIEQHCGSIRAESKLGHGAIFELRLPRHQLAQTPAHMTAKRTPEKPWPGKQVPEINLAEQPVPPQPISLSPFAPTTEPSPHLPRESLPTPTEHHAAPFGNQLGATQ